MTLTSPRLATTPAEIVVVRRRLREHGWYARCFANLRAPVDALLRHGIEIPREKGYVFYETCPADNTPLRQDPFKPRDHVCPTCGRNYTEAPYHRAWVTFFQSYLAQRLVDLGIVYQVTRDPAYAAAVRQVLATYARTYENYPLADCVLGPTRLFQSTYIESLWLANLALAADLVAETIPADEWQMLRDGLFLPAVEVIRDYDEGDNNRQAMNNAAIGLVGLLFDEAALVEDALHGPHGWLHHLAASVGDDGLWYEGDNYHFASLPAMANLADAASRNGIGLYRIEAGGRRFKMMFDGPLQDLYPDLTFPARKDSRFAAPIGQRWYVGLYELAYRQFGDPTYARLLRRLYAAPPAARSGIANAAGLIDVLPSWPADRERLDWRGFMNAVPDLGQEAGIPVTTSVNMAGTGLGILRQAGGQTYASIDYGQYGGGHGHPDRLHLNFYARGRRWLADWGTGNYYFDHLRWYRSSIGHNTMVLDGRTQQAVEGRCWRFAATPARQLVAAEVEELYPGVRAWRAAALLSPDLLLDLSGVEAEQAHQVDWALHPEADLAVDLAGIDAPPCSTELAGEHYEWLGNPRAASANGDWTANFRQDGDHLAVRMVGAAGTEVILADAYGPPDQIPRRFPVLLARRTAARAVFAALHEHQPGGLATIAAFSELAEGTYEVRLIGGGSYRCQFDAASAALAVVHRDAAGAVRDASGFGVAAIPDVLVANVPLEYVDVRRDGEAAHLDLPGRFGQVRMLDPAVTRVVVNGAAPVPGLLVRQEPAAWVSTEARHVWSGVPNQVDLLIHNDRDTPLAGDLDLGLPAGWSLVAPAPAVALDPWTCGRLPIQIIPVPTASDGAIAIGLTGDRLPLTAQAPLGLDAWLPNRAGATLRLLVTNRTGTPRSIRVSAGAWEQVIGVDRAASLDLPVDWERAFPLSVRAECGAYAVARELAPPIAFVGGEYRLDQPAQVRRGERPWRGPDDLSARFRVERAGGHLLLRIAVTDDVVRAHGPADKPFDLDSVQVYLDPRPDADRARTDLGGIVSLLLIPASPAGEPDRVLPIGPVPASAVSTGMALPAMAGAALRSTRRADGYDLELTLPLDRLGGDPRPGDKIGFDLIVNDNDGTYRRAQQLIWTGAGETRIWLRQDYHAPQRYGGLVF